MKTKDSEKISSPASQASPKGSELSSALFKTSLAMVMAGLLSTGYSMENSPSLQKVADLQNSHEQAVSVYSSSPESSIVKTDTLSNLKSISSHSFANPDVTQNDSGITPLQNKEQALSYLARVIDAGAFQIETPISSIRFRDADEVLAGDKNAQGVYTFFTNSIDIKSNHRANIVLLHEMGHHFLPKGNEMREQLRAPSATTGPNAIGEKDRVILEHVVGKPGHSSLATSLADWGELTMPSKFETLVGPNAFRKAKSSHMHHEWLADSFRMYSIYKLGGADEVINKLSSHHHVSRERSPENELKMPNRQRIAMANLIETLVQYQPSELAPIKEGVIPDLIRESMQRSIVDQHMFDRSVQLNLFIKTSDGLYSPATDFQNYRLASDYFAKEVSSENPQLKIDKDSAMTLYDPAKKDIMILSKDGSIKYHLGNESVENPSLSSHLKNHFPLVTPEPERRWNKGVFDLDKIESLKQEAALQRNKQANAQEIDSQTKDLNSEFVSVLR